jgi:hypothetical protein
MEKWYHPKVEMKWHKDMGAEERRQNALLAHGGDELAAAQALQALANVTTDRETKRLARADARYFYGEHKKVTRYPLPRSKGVQITPKRPRLPRMR